jgi:hypothetical protein
MLTQPGAALVDLALDELLSRIKPRHGLRVCRIAGADSRCNDMGAGLGVVDRGVPEMLAVVHGVTADAFDEPGDAAEKSHRVPSG